jgi:hypothetical protein
LGGAIFFNILTRLMRTPANGTLGYRESVDSSPESTGFDTQLGLHFGLLADLKGSSERGTSQHCYIKCTITQLPGVSLTTKLHA